MYLMCYIYDVNVIKFENVLSLSDSLYSSATVLHTPAAITMFTDEIDPRFYFTKWHFQTMQRI